MNFFNNKIVTIRNKIYVLLPFIDANTSSSTETQEQLMMLLII